ncbi:MAG TPA: 3-deoxy-manno-octulosonate cytidylyltransferase [Desulfobacterales bacterium]|nr:3-deoxy-manno-octulosonate cytidylyltransferase [Desulfobacterales bacterium]HIP38355.1 3-deoxy-manno-octulosonate cytidylyltransferase [Desulfocapsa sulfexigens]
MNAIGIIPARLGASRFPGKPLEKMLDMPMVGHCYHRTRLAPGISNAYVATCDREIADYVSSIGGRAIMTSDSHTRATTRTAEALEIIERETGEIVDIVVMVQGDEPLISPETIGDTLGGFTDDSIEIVNVMSRIRTLEAFQDKNNVKVVVNQDNDALYFSREAIPSPWKGWEHLPRYMQTGIIAFRRDTLISFNAMEESSLEQVESVDMNRVIETGGRIRMVLTEAETIGVDTREELIEAEQLLRSDPVVKRYLSL